MKQLTWLTLFVVMLLHAVAMIVGCQSSEAPVSSQPATALPAAESKVLMDPAATMPILRGALIQPHVVSARALLEADGYSYVEANSMVLIRGTRQSIPTDFDAASRGPQPPRDPARADCIWTDTLSWLAFENPTHDLANHTAVMHLTDGRRSGTVLVELDISDERPVVVRQGFVSDSGYVPADIGTQGWLACTLGGAGASAVRCAFTNCAWGHCAAVGAGASLVGCTIGWLADKYL